MIAERSLVVRSGIQLASPLAFVVGVMLFFGGHNQPGGGFAAGLVFGSIVALRSVVGLSVPHDARLLLAAGGTVVGAVALAPLFAGNSLLDMVVVETTLPVLGKVKTGTALVFDLGVTLIVVGLVVALLDGLGAGELDEPGVPSPEIASDPLDGLGAGELDEPGVPSPEIASDPLDDVGREPTRR